MAINWQQPTIQSIQIDTVAVDVLRLDVIHESVSGNKWYKLLGHFAAIQDQQLEGFVTFGGAYSNHLHAAAFAGAARGWKMVALVRGEELEHNSSPTLAACKALGMELVFVSRAQYKQRYDASYLADIQQQYPHLALIPEGGSGPLGTQGFSELQPFIDKKYSHICISVGSGTSLLGIQELAHPHQSLLGFVPMKAGSYSFVNLPINTTITQLIDQFHFGGFGKHTESLLAFMNTFYETYHIPTDQVYTGKMFYGIQQMIREGYWDKNSSLLAIHTGGLQGNVSIKDKLVY